MHLLHLWILKKRDVFGGEDPEDTNECSTGMIMYVKVSDFQYQGKYI